MHPPTRALFVNSGILGQKTFARFIHNAFADRPAGIHATQIVLTHAFPYRFLRQGFPMTLPWGIDWSPADVRGRGRCLFHLCFPIRRARAIHCHESTPLLGFRPQRTLKHRRARSVDPVGMLP